MSGGIGRREEQIKLDPGLVGGSPAAHYLVRVFEQHNDAKLVSKATRLLHAWFRHLNVIVGDIKDRRTMRFCIHLTKARFKEVLKKHNFPTQVEQLILNVFVTRTRVLLSEREQVERIQKIFQG